MKLQMSSRTAGKKSETKQLRREGKIPAIIYVKGNPGESISVRSDELMAHMRKVQSGHLPVTIFNLVTSKGKQRPSIIKEIDYHPTTYDVRHLDFEELHDDVPVNVKVPIEFVGVADCVGIKQGGALRQVIRYLRVRCLPRDIPTSFELNVRDMGPQDSRKLGDLPIPSTVRPLADLNEVAAVIVKR